ncbi:MAG: DinB family protein [Acidimicrobiales bacterium]
MTEMDDLHATLRHQRAHVLSTLEGLDDDQLSREVLPSGWSAAQMVRHLAYDVECFWFLEVFAGQSVERPVGPRAGWTLAPGDAAHTMIERYVEQCALADEVIATHGAEDLPAAWPDVFGSWRLENLREMMLHVITETACHAGHLDATRELIDGHQSFVID